VGEGTTRSLDFGCAAKGPTVLVIPSLIHRTISPNSCPSAAFCGILRVSVSGCSSSIGEPAACQRRHFALADYIAGRLEAAFAAARRIADGPIGVVGYCIGGSSRSRCERQAACLALLATPWDFHA
jgi:polyhydroxyalkanoate synthase subunit PhaC